MGKEQKPHYSEKGGHKARGQHWWTEEAIESVDQDIEKSERLEQLFQKLGLSQEAGRER